MADIKKRIKLSAFNKDHIGSIMEFFKSKTGRPLSKDRLNQSVEKYPSCICWLANDIIGFGYSTRFAPDILEISNIYVDESYRNQRIGSSILGYIEKKSTEKYSGLILVNSLLYNSSIDKKLAINFYKRNGYRLVCQTTPSKVFFKNLS